MTERKLKLVKNQKDHTRQTRQAGRNQKHSAKHSAEPILSLSKASVHSPSTAERGETEGHETEKSQAEENQIQNPKPITSTNLRAGPLKFEGSVHNLSTAERSAPEGNAVERSEAKGGQAEENQIQNLKSKIQNPNRIARQVMLRRIMAELIELDSITPAA